MHLRIMAFKSAPPTEIIPASPEEILLTLPRRKIPGVLLHQGEMMRNYASGAVGAADVGLQLPTGSGKTLVGLMIAEWRRRKFRERIVYLCPTRQLVNQVVEQARDQYGLTVLGFTGPKSDYSALAKAQYQNADHVAVTTYSSLFNTHPFFSNPDVIIVDDAHAAENYIAETWTLRVQRTDPQHRTLFQAMCAVLDGLLSPLDRSRLAGRWDASPDDRKWVEKLPTPDFALVADELAAVIDAHAQDLSIRFVWSLLRGHLRACHLYLSATEIMIRPIVPPTWQHTPFNGARQRIYMSATLGAGGDLERLVGRFPIKRLPVPEGWNRQGIGRRFFIFPENFLQAEEVPTIRTELMKRAGRSLVIVPRDQLAEEVTTGVIETLGYPVFDAHALEESKAAFVGCEKAVAVVANRYDGIDFPGDDCRLLFVEDLPKAANLQERFVMDRMGARQLYDDRVQTRVLQAIGRCTRSLQDYSAVVISGEELPAYLADRSQRAHLHPELQAELAFGIHQSTATTITEVVENFDMFISNGEEWAHANNQILAARSKATQMPFPALGDLEGIVHHEIRYQTLLWQNDHETALAAAESVLGGLTDPNLRGYRAWWHYLAGSAAWLGSKDGVPALEAKARGHFAQAKKAATDVPWLARLTRFEAPAQESEADVRLAAMEQVERIENVLTGLGTLHDRAFSTREKEILEGLAGASAFEPAHVLLGRTLGDIADKRETDASPDPWWLSGSTCFVFEDHAGATNDLLDATKARQVATHPNWVRKNVPLPAEATVTPVLVTPVTSMRSGAAPHLNEVLLWPLDEFRAWATQALQVLRDLRRTFTAAGDLAWRAEAARRLDEADISASALHARLQRQIASQALTEVP
ncbi:DEAD/DEAH box helicase [Acetobacter nitrogenifigens DSM 23921 = NBRC 105050]|uniref:Helicase n=2 Tax=Acetobacter nitrogenifigens TaxID=285268 RepID=A0A511XFA8_9PROT|nr:DEAD/DEAH box helicase [Acetobacter nitrogenifigens DSM 23921 = NBRC 105050]GEN61637.1 helicase [Acetobacter nitrogenifigens DSM 23921 = NBRC 105050]